MNMFALRGKRSFILFIFFMFSYFLIFAAGYGQAQDTTDRPSSPFLSVLLPEQIQTLDSQQAIDPFSLFVIRNIQDGLYEYNLEGNPVPVLASDFPQKSGPLTYRIPLRKGILFQNNTLLKASDVVFTFNRLYYPEIDVLALNLFDVFETFREHDEFTVEIVLKKEIPNLVELLARHELYPLSAAAVSDSLDNYGWITAIGTGPFRFREWFRGSRIVLARNNAYWMNRLSGNILLTLNLFEWDYSKTEMPLLPFYEKVSINTVDNSVQREEQLRKGVADLIVNATYADILNLDDENNVDIVSMPSTRVVQIYLNTESSPFNNQRIRKAFSMCIDRNKLVDEVFKGLAQPASNAIPPWHMAHNKNTRTSGYHPDTAKNILASLGINENNPVQLTLIYTQYQMFDNIAAWIQKSLKKFHFNIILKSLPKDTLFDYVYGRNGMNRQEFQAALEDWQDWKQGYDPEQFLYPLYYSGSSENKVKYNDLETDRLLLLGINESNPVRKNLMFQHIEKLVSQSYSTVVLCVPDICIIKNSALKGLKMNHHGETALRACR